MSAIERIFSLEMEFIFIFYYCLGLWSRHYCVCSRVHMQAMVYWRWVPVDLSIAAVT